MTDSETAGKSEAYNRALLELDRLWDASNQLDAKMLQVLGIISAGVFAAAGLIFSHPAEVAGLRLLVKSLMCGAMACYGAFALVILGTLIQSFSGPFSPSAIARNVSHLDDSPEFRRLTIVPVGNAFEKNLKAHQHKADQFGKACQWLICCICLTMLALGVAVFLPR